MFKNARGRNQARIIADPLVRKGVRFWMERVLGFYGPKGGVDVEVLDGMLILNEKTAAYIYSKFTPLKLRYARGSRPMLEKVVKAVTRPGMSDRARAIALMRRVRDNRDHGLRTPSLFYGGDEEDLLRRGALMCNEVSRLYVCLCQIAGVPARLVGAHISGHMMAEVHTGGKWGWVDPMKGMFPLNRAGEPASTWELSRDPSLFERQTGDFWDDVRPPAPLFGTSPRNRRDLAFLMAKARSCYFHPREAIAIGNYYAWEHDRYTFPWRLEPYDMDRLLRARHAEVLNRKALGWPDFYHNHFLLDEKLKFRRG